MAEPEPGGGLRQQGPDSGGCALRPGVAIAGCGYVGCRLAHLLAAEGRRVLAGTRDPARLRPHLPPGAVPIWTDLDAGNGVAALAGAPLVVVALPPPRSGERDPRSARLASALACHPPRRLVYLSSVGVYGDRAGAWVSETSPPAPGTARARRRMHAEGLWRRFGRRTGTSVTLLRVAGIYGPGRLPVAGVREGGAYRVDWPEIRYTNPIHVDDLVGLIRAALHRGAPNRVYNGCDGAEHRQGALQEAVASALGLSPPPWLSPAEAEECLSAMRLSFLRESRRCSNARARGELLWVPRYPDLAQGVRASLREEGMLRAADAGTASQPLR